MTKPRTVLITGATGVGKSACARDLQAATGWGLVSASALVLEAARDLFGVAHRDDVKRLGRDDQARIHAEARVRVREALVRTPVSLLDDHLVVLASGGGEIILPPADYVPFYGVEAIVVIEAAPARIRAQVAGDQAPRHRLARSDEEIAAEQARVVQVARGLQGGHRVIVADRETLPAGGLTAHLLAILHPIFERNRP